MRHVLADPDLLREAALVAGHWRAATGSASIAVTDPATGDRVGAVPRCDAADTEAAIEAARIAQRDWKRVPAAGRAAILREWQRLMGVHADDLARIMTREQGKPLAEARGEVEYAASFLGWFAAEAERLGGEMLRPTADRRVLVSREPVGVTAAITPWNFPLAMITRKCAPALAAGCSMVIKPSELTPFSALALGVLAERAGLPPGLLSILTGDAAVIGPVLTGSAVVRKLSFTGSTRVGALLMRDSAPSIKKLSLELGGNAPLLVFDDAPLEAALAGAMVSKFRNAGQTCVCANRVYVQDGIHDRFVRGMSERIGRLSVGDGFAAGVEIGPLINDAAVDKVRAHVEDALGKGARIVDCGFGTAFRAENRFVHPLLLVGATDEMLVAREETFGPVLPVFRFRTEQEAVERANNTPFGLASYLFTDGLDRAFRVSDALEFGMVGLNTGAVSMASAPFGGVKQSGLGREGGNLGMDEFLEAKTVHLAATGG